MFESWPEVLRKMGTPSRKGWWQGLRERGEEVVAKVAMEET